MEDRREFLKKMAALGLLGLADSTLLTNLASAENIATERRKAADNKIWGCLLHLSFNMWEDYINPARPFRGYRPDLELDEKLWNDAVNEMHDQGCNLILIDLGDAVKYDSHPEIAVNNAWSTSRMRSEIRRLKKLGLEPIPKLNFSAGHDTWLKEYSKMVSTKKYYEVCSDLIKEVADIFDGPRLFHLGMDEEDAGSQADYNYIVCRNNDAWWNDFFFLVDEVEKNNSRAWIWPDYMLWRHTDQFYKKMPKSVVISNWYYGEELDPSDSLVHAYLDLAEKGYDQIPTASYHDYNTKSIGSTVEFAKKNFDNSHLLGFLQTIWRPTIEENRDRVIGGIKLLGEAKRKYYE